MATLVLEHSDISGSDRFGEILRDHGHRLRVVRLHEGGALPPDLDGIDAVLACGGPQSPLDDSIPWLGAEIGFLRRAHEAALPVVGLCLGCQLLGRALGGRVEKLSSGIECGWHRVRLTPEGREDPLFAGLPWESEQLHWHRYHVAEAPPGARVLASSQRTKVDAWASGLRTYAFQYHPEMYPGTIEACVRDEPDDLAEAGLTPERMRAETKRCYDDFERLSRRLFERAALCLMPLDRRSHGLARDLHH